MFLFVYFHRQGFLWQSAVTGTYFKGASKVCIINVFSKGKQIASNYSENLSTNIIVMLKIINENSVQVCFVGCLRNSRGLDNLIKTSYIN